MNDYPKDANLKLIRATPPAGSPFARHRPPRWHAHVLNARAAGVYAGLIGAI